MPAPARRVPLHLWLLMVLVPAAWSLLNYFGVLSPLRNMATNTIYRIRGQIPAYDGTKPGHPPLKIIYVDIDSPTMALWGNQPWSRSKYAQLITALNRYGRPAVIGLDIFLGPIGMGSDLVDKNKAREGNEEMQAVMQDFPNVVLATHYSGTIHPFASKMAEVMELYLNFTENAPIPNPNNPYSQRLANLPLMYMGATDPKKNGYPEGPTYPIIGDGYGRVGLITVAVNYSAVGAADSVPRWVPLFVETEGPEHALNLIYGLAEHNGWSLDQVLPLDNELVLFKPDGGEALRVPLIQKRVFYNLALELALTYLGLDHSNIRRTHTEVEIVDKDGQVLLHIPLHEGQLVPINWFTKWDNPLLNPHVSGLQVAVHLGDIASDDPAKKAAAEKFFAQFNDAIILIGPTDPSLQDLAPTPFDSVPVPKVGVYGNLLKTFFTGKYLHRPSEWVNLLTTFGLTFVVGGLAIYTGPRSALAKLGAAGVLGLYVVGAILTFDNFTLVLPLVAPLGAALTTSFAGVILRLVDEERQKRRIKGMFGTYLAPEVVNKMVESGQEPQLGGHLSPITCFFSDVQGFSTFSEVLTPDQLTTLMNEYFTPMTDLLMAEKGSLDKYIGDAIVAMFGAPVSVPGHALRAAVAACKMHRRLGELRAHWRGLGDQWPPLVHRMRMRIGLNTGEATVGNMGSAARFNFTMMGDTVNLGARCESAAKQFGVYTMCTEDTMKAATAAGDDVLFRRLNKIIVKGKTLPVEVYEVVCLRADASPDTLRCVEIFERGLAAYFAQKWDEALALFAESEKLEPLQPGRDEGVAHNPSELMQEDCREMKAHPPPADWNGVKELKDK